MIILYFLLGILLLLTALMLQDVSLVFSYKDNFDLIFKLSFISIKGNKIIELVESSDKDESKKAEILKNKTAVYKKKKSPTDIIDTVTYILDLIGEIFGEFSRYARLKLTKIKISISTDSCAETALIYGFASSVLYTALEVLDSYISVKRSYKNIGIYPDFLSNESKIDLKIILKIKIIHLLLAFIHVLPSISGVKKGK